MYCSFIFSIHATVAYTPNHINRLNHILRNWYTVISGGVLSFLADPSFFFECFLVNFFNAFNASSFKTVATFLLQFTVKIWLNMDSTNIRCIQNLRNMNTTICFFFLKNSHRIANGRLGDDGCHIYQDPTVKLVEVAVVQQVVCWLIRRKARMRALGQKSKQNTKINSSAISSQHISGKNSGSKKNCHEKFHKRNLSFGIDFKLQVPALMYKIKTHNISGVRNQVNNPD